MSRWNGSLLGVPNTTDAAIASGFFSTNEALIKGKEGKFPRTVAVSDYFPTEYMNVIDGFTGTKLYLSSVFGNDDFSGTTAASSFRTFDKLNTTINALTEPAMAIILPGNYTGTSLAPSSSASAILWDKGYERQYLLAPKLASISWTSGSQRDAGIIAFSNANSKVYGGIFNRNNNGKSVNYSAAFFPLTWFGVGGGMYNCVIDETNGNGNWSLQYNNSGLAGYIEYCTFAVGQNGLTDYSGGSTFQALNCEFNYAASTSATITGSINPVPNNNISPTTYLADPPSANAGVYKGTYAWPA